jgi:hypothetical protein
MMVLSFILERITRLRRNHALEHAILQVLAQHGHSGSIAGYSDWNGCWIAGDISTEELFQAAEEAMGRLRNGESGLAIHPACGTNFVVSGAVAGTAAWLAMLLPPNNLKKKLERWPLVVALITVVLMFTQPLGPRIQANFTTEANMGALHIRGIIRSTHNRWVSHRILTEASNVTKSVERVDQ